MNVRHHGACNPQPVPAKSGCEICNPQSKDRLTQSGQGYNGNANPPASALTYDQATNRITTSGYSYDANGNITNMPELGTA